MNLLKRIFLSVGRNKGKSILLLIIVGALGTMMSGAIAINQSITQTRNNLWRGLPPVAMIERDHEEINRRGNLRQVEHLEFETLSRVSNLPYVRSYDIFQEWSQVRWLYHFELEEYFFPEQPHASFQMENDIFRARIQGVINPNIFDIEAGVIELVAGRTFTETEINSNDFYHSQTLISRRFAELNNLMVGDSVHLEQRFHYHHFPFMWEAINGFFWTGYVDYSDDTLLLKRIYHFEIIGIFDPIVSTNWGSDETDMYYLAGLENAFYVPLIVAQEVNNFYSEQEMLFLQSRYDEQSQISDNDQTLSMLRNEMRRLVESQEIRQNFPHYNNIFLLHDSADIIAFQEAAIAILPDFTE